MTDRPFYAHDVRQILENDRQADAEAAAKGTTIEQLEARLRTDYDAAMRDGTADRLLRLKTGGGK